jgi:hypothetical protein
MPIMPQIIQIYADQPGAPTLRFKLMPQFLHAGEDTGQRVAVIPSCSWTL